MCHRCRSATPRDAILIALVLGVGCWTMIGLVVWLTWLWSGWLGMAALVGLVVVACVDIVRDDAQ